MSLKNRNSIIFLLTICFVTKLNAQNLGASRFSGAVNSTGSDSFVVANNGRQQIYQTGTIPANGLALQNSDMIQTGPGNYVEVQLDPSGAIIKLAENTSVIFNDLGSSNRSALVSFLYGRMRIMNQGSNGTVTVQAGNAAIEFSRGDLALDYAVIPGSANRHPQLQVSTLSGTAQIISSVASPGAARMPVYEHETVIFDVTTRLAVLNRQPLNQEIAAYWSRNGFKQAGMAPHSTYLAQGTRSSLPPLGAYPASSLAGAEPQAERLPIDGNGPNYDADVVWMSADKATLGPKNGGILWGTLFTTLGILTQSLIHYDVFGFDTATNDQVYAFSYASIAAGLITLIATYAYSYKEISSH
jgi:hypothetical protein